VRSSKNRRRAGRPDLTVSRDEATEVVHDVQPEADLCPDVDLPPEADVGIDVMDSFAEPEPAQGKLGGRHRASTRRRRESA
jgi:hypothetical protein